jgi:Flp pilus assembly protein TadB
VSTSHDYYSIIAQAVLKLPNNTTKARQELYSHARAALARQLEQDPARIKRERRALEKAIRQVESRAALNIKQLNRTGYESPSTALLIASILFLGGLWVLDCTAMSSYWVVARLPKTA